jgi:hypothetical protein
MMYLYYTYPCMGGAHLRRVPNSCKWKGDIYSAASDVLHLYLPENEDSRPYNHVIIVVILFVGK